jgi:hypothetical protein
VKTKDDKLVWCLRPCQRWRLESGWISGSVQRAEHTIRTWRRLGRTRVPLAMDTRADFQRLCLDPLVLSSMRHEPEIFSGLSNGPSPIIMPPHGL